MSINSGISLPIYKLKCKMTQNIVGLRLGISQTTLAWSQSTPRGPVNCSEWKDLLGLLNDVMPSIVIFSSDMKIQTFGYEAVEQNQSGNTDDFLVFSNFIQQIFCDGPKVVDKIKADNGEFVSSEEVMYKVIYYILSKYAVQDLSTLLVLTVPSATRDLDDACKFLEKVARKAGQDMFLVIPDAIAILYHCIDVTDLSTKESLYHNGKRNFVLECEDDYICCSVIEELNASMEVVYKKSIKKPSFHQIKRNLEKIFITIFGKDIFDKFDRNHCTEYCQFDNDIRRKIACSGRDSKVIMQIPNTFFNHTDGVHVKSALQQSSNADSIEIVGNKLKIPPHLYRRVFKEVGENISQLLRMYLQETGMFDVEGVAIFLVGNLSQSVVLQNTIKSDFPKHNLIIPGDPCLNVVKGALLYGKETARKNQMECEQATFPIKTSSNAQVAITQKHSTKTVSIARKATTNNAKQMRNKKKTKCVIS